MGLQHHQKKVRKRNNKKFLFFDVVIEKELTLFYNFKYKVGESS